MLGSCPSFVVSYFTLKPLKYLEFYGSLGKELLWPRVQARHSLLSLSDIFTVGPSLSASYQVRSSHVCFFLSGPTAVMFLSEELPSSSNVLFFRTNLPGWAAEDQIQSPCRSDSTTFSSPAPLASSLTVGLLHREWAASVSVPPLHVRVFKWNTKLCYTFSKNWDRQLLSGRDLVFGWVEADVGCMSKVP